MDLAAAWSGLTEGQGAVIASLFTVVAAILGVFLGWRLFSGRVRDLQSALDASESSVKGHIAAVELALGGYERQIIEQLDSFAIQLSHIGASVANLPTDAGPPAPAAQQDARNELRECWGLIQDRIEAHATNPQIDGRTRAKYSRIDRRKYSELIEALAGDGVLAPNDHLYRQAVNLWLRFRNGRAVPTREELEAMRRLAHALGQ